TDAVRLVKRRRRIDQDRRRRVDHPFGCEASAPRLEARSAAQRRKAWRWCAPVVGHFWKPIDSASPKRCSGLVSGGILAPCYQSLRGGRFGCITSAFFASGSQSSPCFKAVGIAWSLQSFSQPRAPAYVSPATGSTKLR